MRQRAVRQCILTVDEYVLEARRKCVRMLARRPVLNALWVQDNQVGKGAGLEDAPVLRTETRSGRPGHPADRFFPVPA